MSMNAVNSGPPEPDNKRAPVAGGSGPPSDPTWDRRLTVLETRFDTILPTLATKADLTELRLDLERMFFNLQAKLREEMNGLREDMSTLRDDMNKLRVEVHAGLTSMMKWGVGIAITVILGVAGQGIYLNKQIADQHIHLSKQIADQNINLSKQIADLAARLPPAGVSAPLAPGRPPAAQLAPAFPPQAGIAPPPRSSVSN